MKEARHSAHGAWGAQPTLLASSHGYEPYYAQRARVRVDTQQPAGGGGLGDNGDTHFLLELEVAGVSSTALSFPFLLVLVLVTGWSRSVECAVVAVVERRAERRGAGATEEETAGITRLSEEAGGFAVELELVAAASCL